MKIVMPIGLIGLIAITLIASSACNRSTTSECFPGKSRPIHEIETSKSKYLPKAFQLEYLNEEDTQAEARMDKWYSEHLLSLKEPSLLAPASRKEEIYRFVWLRSFEEPVSIRVKSEGKKRDIFIKKTDSKHSSVVGKLNFDHSRSLSDEEWQQFLILLENTCFWGMRSWDDRLGKDGAFWILKGVNGGRHHIVARWSPGGGDFQEAYQYLIRLSELSPKDIY